MNPRRRLDCLARWIGVLAIALIAPATQAEETEGYGLRGRGPRTLAAILAGGNGKRMWLGQQGRSARI